MAQAFLCLVEESFSFLSGLHFHKLGRMFALTSQVGWKDKTTYF